MTGELNVYLGNRLVGTLSSADNGNLSFVYSDEWLNDPDSFPLSLYLPKRRERYPDEIARPFFVNLLPEATVLAAVARKLGISSRNHFALLAAIGGECAGAVSLLPQGSDPSTAGSYREVTDEELDGIIGQMPQRPFLAGEEGVRLSLAGAQYKLPVFIRQDGTFCLALGNAPSSHIIKPEMAGIEYSVRNEALCMDLAARLGLPVPETLIRQTAHEVLVVKRFDRTPTDDGSIARLHQEDFCQALGFMPDTKYETEGGPGLKACFGLLERFSASPAKDRQTLLNWVVFNALIHNADAHAKNISILYTAEGIRLAPFYDLLCTGLYEGISEKMAMRIGNENRPKWIVTRHWERFAQEVGIGAKLVFRTLSEMSEVILPVFSATAQEHCDRYGDSKVYQNLELVLERQVRHIKATLS